MFPELQGETHLKTKNYRHPPPRRENIRFTGLFYGGGILDFLKTLQMTSKGDKKTERQDFFGDFIKHH